MNVIDTRKNIITFLNNLFKKVGKNITDIEIGPYKGLFIKLNGNITYVNIGHEKLHSIYMSFFGLLNNYQKEEFRKKMSFDISENFPELGKVLRLHFYKEKAGFMLSIRIRETQEIKMENIGLEKEDIEKIKNTNSGLILVTGPTGSGKSTTLAAIINEKSYNYKAHVITIEDPIEYIFPEEKRFITQKEIGTSIESFASGVKESLRENPDILMISEIRDTETATNIIHATRTGILTLSTIHSLNIPDAISRYIALLPDNSKRILKQDLTEILKIVINQRLIYVNENGEKKLKLIYEIINFAEHPELLSYLRENPSINIENFYNLLYKENIKTIDIKLEELLTKGQITEETYKNNLIYN